MPGFAEKSCRPELRGKQRTPYAHQLNPAIAPFSRNNQGVSMWR
jgi:hypothetical protein